MITGHRTYLRVGGLWLLLASGVHLVGHWLTFASLRIMDPVHRVPVEELISTPAGEEMWMLFNQFSLAFALFLLLSGTASLIASRRSVAHRDALHWSGFAGAFWVLTFGVFLLEPVAPGLIIAGAAAVFHVAAFFTGWAGADPATPAWGAAAGGEPAEGSSEHPGAPPSR